MNSQTLKQSCLTSWSKVKRACHFHWDKLTDFQLDSLADEHGKLVNRVGEIHLLNQEISAQQFAAWQRTQKTAHAVNHEVNHGTPQSTMHANPSQETP